MSSSLKDQIEVDIARFLENIKTQTKNDQVKSLRNLLDKYVHLSSCEYKMDYRDFKEITGLAKQKFASETFPIYLGPLGNKVPPGELPNLCVIEATIGFLNKKDCLKKLPKFDKKKE